MKTDIVVTQKEIGKKALHIIVAIKKYMYIFPIIGILFIYKKDWTSKEVDLYLLYQWVMSCVTPLSLMYLLRWINVL